MPIYFSDKLYKITGIVTSFIGILFTCMMLKMIFFENDRSLDNLFPVSRFIINSMLLAFPIGVTLIGFVIYNKIIKLGEEYICGDELTKKFSNFILSTLGLLPIILGMSVIMFIECPWDRLFMSVKGLVYVLVITVFWYSYISNAIFLWQNLKNK